MSVDFIVFKGSANDGIVEAIHNRSGLYHTFWTLYTPTWHWDTKVWAPSNNLGDGVMGLKVGDLVGWGPLKKVCGACEQSISGSFGSHAVRDSSFLFEIPAWIAPEDAAPLMYGGATVFTVIDTYNIRPTDRVGIVGIGGLGHLANTEKHDEAFSLGASKFYATSRVTELNIAKPWKMFLDIMKPTGRIYPLTFVDNDLVLPAMQVLSRGLCIQGSALARRRAITKMLDFAALHNIKPIIERFPVTKNGVEEGMAKLREGRMRYRGVLLV
ncbi:NADP-dependent alcohol dehydrogenase [Mycena crocata]|nr:NADP-dependent alcohol dehydrogenase [Mycena crocata]